MSSTKDTLFSNPVESLSSFKFDSAVVNVFPDMIQRSVPGYQTIIYAIGLLAARYARDHSVCYDLGCSLGAATLSMRHQMSAKHCKIIAVDNSAAMLQQFKKNLQDDKGEIEVDVVCADIRDLCIENASVVVLNFTLQFLPVADRDAFLKKIYQGLLPGGILILSEKLSFEDEKQQTLQTDLHHLFKKSQGYSDMEISQKRSALDNVLIAETFANHQQRLQAVGFSSVAVWFQYFNFASIVAIK
ncbi:MAG: carboxy-S-adenosyl-L-methionine synthase CmoA [Methylococcales bacterium]|jgi:tRNA (cmo5U34)-methyltransferase